MHLSKFSDYALRAVLLAASRPGTFVTIKETAEFYAISQAHLKKVIRHLAQRGYVDAVRGHGGGFALARPASEINLGALLRDTEPDFALVECFRAGNACRITRGCHLPGVFSQALGAFWAVLDHHTLHDVVVAPEMFGPLVAMPDRGARG
ncbi:MAG: RrF2 family transcriptional regulator [Pararhodobacter sp.]